MSSESTLSILVHRSICAVPITAGDPGRCCRAFGSLSRPRVLSDGCSPLSITLNNTSSKQVRNNAFRSRWQRSGEEKKGHYDPSRGSCEPTVKAGLCSAGWWGPRPQQDSGSPLPSSQAQRPHHSLLTVLCGAKTAPLGSQCSALHASAVWGCWLSGGKKLSCCQSFLLRTTAPRSTPAPRSLPWTDCWLGCTLGQKAGGHSDCRRLWKGSVMRAPESWSWNQRPLGWARTPWRDGVCWGQTSAREQLGVTRLASSHYLLGGLSYGPAGLGGAARLCGRRLWRPRVLLWKFSGMRGQGLSLIVTEDPSQRLNWLVTGEVTCHFWAKSLPIFMKSSSCLSWSVHCASCSLKLKARLEPNAHLVCILGELSFPLICNGYKGGLWSLNDPRSGFLTC